MRELPSLDITPAISVAVATLLAAVPWGLPSEARFLMPLLPLAVIHYWAARRPDHMPEWLVFASGLGTDVLTHGPLGFWSFIYLSGYMLCRLVRLYEGWGRMGQWLEFALLMVMLAVLQWLIASGYFLGAIDWRPLLRGGVLAILLYPVVMVLLGSFDTPDVAVDDKRFERRT